MNKTKEIPSFLDVLNDLESRENIQEPDHYFSEVIEGDEFVCELPESIAQLLKVKVVYHNMIDTTKKWLQKNQPTSVDSVTNEYKDKCFLITQLTQIEDSIDGIFWVDFQIKMMDKIKIAQKALKTKVMGMKITHGYKIYGYTVKVQVYKSPESVPSFSEDLASLPGLGNC